MSGYLMMRHDAPLKTWQANFPSAQRHSALSVALNRYKIINAIQANSGKVKEWTGIPDS